MPEDLTKMTVKKLREMAKARGIKRVGVMLKATLIKRIEEIVVGAAAEPISKGEPVVAVKGLKKFKCLTGVISNGLEAPVIVVRGKEHIEAGSSIVPAGSVILLPPDKPYVKRWIKLGAIK